MFEVHFILFRTPLDVVDYGLAPCVLVDREFDNSNDARWFIEEATEAYNESIATYSLSGYVLIEKVDNKITRTEHVHYSQMACKVY